MGRSEFIHDLIDLLIRMDRGMMEFEEPLPRTAVESIVSAVVSFGHEVVPRLNTLLAEEPEDMDFTYLVDALGMIGHPSSVPYIIDKHRHASFVSGAAALSALKTIRTDEALEYLGRVLTQYSAGDERVIESAIELVIACQALGEWGDHRAISPLKDATRIQGLQGMPDAAIQALAKYPQGHQFLHELADREPSLKGMIKHALQDTPQHGQDR